MEKTIIGFAGEIASGKDTAVNYLKKKYGGATLKFSACLRDTLDRLYLEQSRENLQKLSTILREGFSQNLFSKVVSKDAEKSDQKLIVIDGVRRQTDVASLKNLPGFILVYIEADEKLRYERLVKRNENEGDATKNFKDFQKEGQAESENQIRGMKSIANVVISNNKNIENFYSQLDLLINQT